jgi:amino acid adenylation domain-containing protein
MRLDNIESFYPLSPIQQGILFQSLYAVGSPVYFGQLSFTFQEGFKVEEFKRAWQAVVDRHPILRTYFVWEGLDEHIQVVEEKVELKFDEFDWRRTPPDDIHKQLDLYLQTDLERGFDYATAPLMRLALIRLTDAAYRFIWSHHHLIVDGWSVPLIFNEVFGFYEAFCKGEQLELPPPRPYRDYIIWLQQQDLKKAERYWRDILQGFTDATRLGIDKGISEAIVGGLEFDEQEIELSIEATDRARSFARRRQLTLNTIVQGAWAILLSRYSGEQDVVYGATVSGRPAELEDVESMVGLFINTLPVRVRMNRTDTVVDFLKRLQEQLVEIRQFEYSPLVEVQGWSDVRRGAPLFESILVFENYPVRGGANGDGVSVKVSAVNFYERTNYPLTLVAGAGAQLKLKALYDTHRLDSAALSRVMKHLADLIETITEDAERRVFDLSLLDADEERRLLVEWNDTRDDYEREKAAHQLFEEQVERTPNATALVSGQDRLTYRELNNRANQLAHHLQKLGVGPETMVGIAVDRSVEMVVGVLGTLKAGGAYAPLDPSYPKDRLDFMIRDAQVKVLLTDNRLIQFLPETEAVVVALDTQWEIISSESADNPACKARADNLAYVIYTSGTTGAPKGVLLEHRGLNNLIAQQTRAFDITPNSRVLQFSSFSFDASVSEVFVTLIQGATLYIASKESLQPDSPLIGVLKDNAISTVTLSPSVLAVLPAHELSDLGTVISAGEACTSEIVRKWADGRRFINAYGPTEATVCATMSECLESGQSPTIGRPIGNTQIYLLDKNMRPVPIGAPGEIYIGGVGLARGYLNRPELTAERFIPNAFANEPGARLYRTGDLARHMTDGCLEYLGRRDNQVKLRGFRIELGEIEALLSQREDIKQAVVIDREERPGDKRLIAYVVAKQQSPLSVNHLRGYLKDKLPEFMVPSTFVFMDALPTSPNGKLDRRALPEVDAQRPDLEESFVAPRSEAERVIAEIWKETLKLEEVGVNDNFFDLGGHSLLMTIMHGKLRQAFGKSLSMIEMFTYPTIEALAEFFTSCKEIEGSDVEESVFDKVYDRVKKQKEAGNKQKQLAGRKRI